MQDIAKLPTRVSWMRVGEAVTLSNPFAVIAVQDVWPTDRQDSFLEGTIVQYVTW